MANDKDPEPKIIVDEDWKAKVEAERAQLEKSQRESAAGPSSRKAGPEPPPRLPPASFLGLCESLVAQAMAELASASREPSATDAEAGDTSAERDPRVHLEIARHLIDTLAVLDEKTRNNLTPAESRYLDGTLHELRMAFVACKAHLGQ